MSRDNNLLQVNQPTQNGEHSKQGSKQASDREFADDLDQSHRREHREQHSGERRPENREKKKFRHTRARVDPKTGKTSFEVQFA